MKTSAHLKLAIELAEKSGKIMRKNFGLAMKKEWKDHRSPVTETDLAINDLVLKTIKKKFPDHSILSEEGDDFSETSEYVWICDPVDGTHNPFLKRLFYAEKGKGAYLNGHRIHVNKNAGLKKTVIGAGKTKKMRNLFTFMDETYDYGVSFITGLSIHYMCALVAVGEFSAALFGGTAAHDMVAGKVLVEEAGGKVTDIFGNTPKRFDRDMEGQLVSNGLLHSEILAIMDRTSPRN
jgi:myo-inositol-1(or 4)-monophosphatase